MAKQNYFLDLLKQRLAELAQEKSLHPELLRNALKEEIQYYVLNFIYHHPQYSQWVMYGGSALRICYNLDRLSIDLDFEIAKHCTKPFLHTLKEELKNHFTENYNFGPEMLTFRIKGTRGILLRFNIGDELGLKLHSKQIHVKIDLEYFVAPETKTTNIPINHSQLSFVIKTYNISTLMASKIAALFLRGKRGVGKMIYDLLWYMGKGIIPDFDYLNAKKIAITDPRTLFDRLTIQIDKVNDANLRQDLTPLFFNQNYIQNWLNQWHETYFHLLNSYKIHTITNLRAILIERSFDTEAYTFTYTYNTEDKHSVKIAYAISDYWLEDREGVIPIIIKPAIISLIHTAPGTKLNRRLEQYATLFNEKNLAYLKKTNNVVFGNTLQTKFIRMTARNLNKAEQIVLNRSALLASKLEDLLKGTATN